MIFNIKFRLILFSNNRGVVPIQLQKLGLKIKKYFSNNNQNDFISEILANLETMIMKMIKKMIISQRGLYSKHFKTKTNLVSKNYFSLETKTKV